MGVGIADNKLVSTTEPKTIHLDLHKDVDNNLKNETDSNIKHNESLPEYTIKNDIRQLL